MTRIANPTTTKASARIRSSLSRLSKSPFNHRKDIRPNSSAARGSPIGRDCGRKSPGRAGRYSLEDRSRAHLYREAETHLDDDVAQDDDVARSDAETSDWDEEATLVALFTVTEDVKFHDITALADRLQPASHAYGAKTKQAYSEILVPVVTAVKNVHSRMEEDMDRVFLNGVATCSQAREKFESLVLDEAREVEAEYQQTKAELSALFGDLQEALSDEDRIFREFEDALRKDIQRLQALASCIPENIEATVSKLEKKAKSLGSKDTAKAKEKLLREILQKY